MLTRRKETWSSFEVGEGLQPGVDQPSGRQRTRAGRLKHGVGVGGAHVGHDAAHALQRALVVQVGGQQVGGHAQHPARRHRGGAERGAMDEGQVRARQSLVVGDAAFPRPKRYQES